MAKWLPYGALPFCCASAYLQYGFVTIASPLLWWETQREVFGSVQHVGPDASPGEFKSQVSFCCIPDHDLRYPEGRTITVLSLLVFFVLNHSFNTKWNIHILAHFWDSCFAQRFYFSTRTKIFIPIHLSFTILFSGPGISKLISYQLIVKSF